MATKDFRGSPEEADRRRADSLAREVFSDIADRRAVLISDALPQNLRMVERNGPFERSAHPVVPPRVEYTLGEPGRAMRVTVDGLRWEGAAGSSRWALPIAAQSGGRSTSRLEAAPRD
ncbi:winged helix-turn-helix transcriptional regulator [Streptomyces sp. NPDC051907]|uniref:winged helix-turn-helix transcriptional regulator n=1 Tax=Streptomyces sp. NPDC051907 TaxID=3155284 RepID=UPI003434283F